MIPLPPRVAGLALLALLLNLHLPSAADSFASSASSAGSASVGSLSDSVQGSSRSSSGATKVAEGDYRVIELAVLADRPGLLRIRLQALALAGDAGTLWLTLPQQALAPRALAVGDTVSARLRPYGVAFARGHAREPFFLALADDWQRELAPRPVTL